MLCTNCVLYNWDCTSTEAAIYKRRRIQSILLGEEAQFASCGLVLFESVGILGKPRFQLEYQEPVDETPRSNTARRQTTAKATDEMLELCKERFLHIVHKDFKDVEVASRLHADRGNEMKDAVISATALRSLCKVLLPRACQRTPRSTCPPVPSQGPATTYLHLLVKKRIEAGQQPL
jgi:hypothetical protein